MRWNGEVDGGGSGRAVPELALVLGWRSPLVRAALAALLEQLGHRVTASVDDWHELGAARVPGALAVVDIDLLPSGARSVPGLPLVVIAPTAGHPAIPAVVESAAAGLILGTENGAALQLCLLHVASGRRWLD